MAMARTFENYKEEIELALVQNACVESELYSIIAALLRESENRSKISIRDVSTRRRSKSFENSYKFHGNAGFPDFVILERRKKSNAEILGCIEAKRPVIPISKEDEQIQGHINSFQRVVYTNGLEWMFFDKNSSEDDHLIFDVILGELIQDEDAIDWKTEEKWIELLNKLDAIEWCGQ